MGSSTYLKQKSLVWQCRSPTLRFSLQVVVVQGNRAAAIVRDLSGLRLHSVDSFAQNRFKS
jgi:hypothetical protein